MRRKGVFLLLKVLVSFLLLVSGVATLLGFGILTPAQAGLMMVALFGMYVGFGILIATYRLVAKLK